MGDTKKYERDRILRAWRRTAGRTKAAPKARTIEEHMAMAESFGIRTRIIPDNGDQNVPAVLPDRRNLPDQDPGNSNITSHTFPESGI